MTKDEYVQKRIDIDVPTGSQCYCGKPRDFNEPDFQCSVCYKWFHLKCISFNVGKSLPFMTSYHFMCNKCNSAAEEVFSRKQANFTVMCQTALANLTFKHDGRLYFSKEEDLIPFLERHWEELTTQPRKPNNSWYPNIHKTLTSSDVFKTVECERELLVCLSNTELAKMGPSYDRFRALTSQLKTNIKQLGSSTPGDGGGGAETPASGLTPSGSSFDSVSDSYTAGGDNVGWRRRKSPGGGLTGTNGASASGLHGSSQPAGQCLTSNQTSNGLSGTAYGGFDASRGPGGGGIAGNNTAVSNGTAAPQTSGLVRSTRRATAAAAISGGLSGMQNLAGPDEGRVKLNALGFPIDHPMNKEGYRYILVELDIHATGRQQWDECEHTAGKPIPGLFYRVFMCPQVVLSLNDRAHQMKLHDSQLSVTGEKGYCMARATHSVHSGSWFYEATITDQPEGAATRIGWSQHLGNLQAPCGYDKFSYSWRSRLGTVFHESRGKHYSEEGYGKDDVIGCLIQLPHRTRSSGNQVFGSNAANLVNRSADRNTEGEPPSEKKAKIELPHQNELIPDTLETMQLLKEAAETTFLPESYKDRPLIKFRNSYYFEEKDEPTKAEKLLRPLIGSKITFYRNGECLGTAFSDIYAGAYYPAISIYRSANVAVNFGPNFKFPPATVPDWQSMCDRVRSAEVEQTMSDMLYLAEKEGYIDQMIKTCSRDA